jgi:hypothetical protein
MSHEFGNVVDHLRSHAGDALRAVFIYRGDDHRDLYRREDVAELHGSDLEAVVLREVQSDHREEDQPADTDGEPIRATVRVFDSKVIVNLPRDADSGTVVVLDPTAARNLTDFVGDLRADLYDGGRGDG